MTPQRATDNIQQKVSDCLGTVNEKPYTLGQRIIDANAPKFESGGIVKKPKDGIFLNGRYAHNPWNCRCIIIPLDDNPKKD